MRWAESLRGRGFQGRGLMLGGPSVGWGFPWGGASLGGRSFPRGRCFPQRGEGGHLDQPLGSQPLGWLPGIRE